MQKQAIRRTKQDIYSTPDENILPEDIPIILKYLNQGIYPAIGEDIHRGFGHTILQVHNFFYEKEYIRKYYFLVVLQGQDGCFQGVAQVRIIFDNGSYSVARARYGTLDEAQRWFKEKIISVEEEKGIVESAVVNYILLQKYFSQPVLPELQEKCIEVFKEHDARFVHEREEV